MTESADDGKDYDTLHYNLKAIGVTLNTYTHLGLIDAKEEVLRLQKVM